MTTTREAVATAANSLGSDVAGKPTNGKLAIPSELASLALAFPEKVESELAACRNIKQGQKLVAAGEAAGRFAHMLKAPMAVINGFGYGVLIAKAGIGEMLPPGKPGRGKKNPVPDAGIFASHTISAYRTLAKHKEQLPAYREAVAGQDSLLEITQSGFLNFLGCGGVIATRHGGGVIEWYTPGEYIEAARKVMASIDLDPASSRYAQKVVKASKYYDRQSDGLNKEWSGTVFLNPPFKMPLVAQFVAKLCDDFMAGRVPQAVLLTNNNTDTNWWQLAAMAASAICFTDRRIRFYNKAGEWSSPTNGQTFCYFGSRATTFCRVFTGFGLVVARLWTQGPSNED